jgi:uncharacterized protein (TIGR00369 family)
MYLLANVNTQLFDTTTAHITKGKAEIGLTVMPKYFHALNAMHGSVYFKLLDDAAFFAVNSVVLDAFVLTKTFEINFKRPVDSGVLRAEGILMHSTSESYKAESKLYNESGKVVAFGSGEFVKSRTKLTSDIGYV